MQTDTNNSTIDEIFESSDGQVLKFIHMDGSETAIKKVKSIQSVFDPINLTMQEVHSDRNKYSIFISCSSGCHMQCKFCHLTLKNAIHHTLPKETVLENIKQAVTHAVSKNKELKNSYVKLSWMGMGDALNKAEMVDYVTKELLKWIFEKEYALGLDGVDLSTVFPKLKSESWMTTFYALEAYLKGTYADKLNPSYNMDNYSFSTSNYSHKSIFRLFYSIESAVQSTRDVLVPNAMPLDKAMTALLKYSNNGQYPVILHHILIDSLNDSDEEINALLEFMNTNFKQNELRILRYNFCAKSTMKESDSFLKAIKKIADNVEFLKVQVSPGSEVSAACGQFIVKLYKQAGKSTNAAK